MSEIIEKISQEDPNTLSPEAFKEFEMAATQIPGCS